MGEYATYQGESVKIGTCEEMWYLRADQAALVHPEPNSLHPIAVAHELRFRFPFPEEDSILPGHFQSHTKRYRVDGMKVPSLLDGLEHASIQFRAEHHGYLVSLPCPLDVNDDELDYTIQRNGYPGEVFIVQQRLTGDHLAVVLQCNCGVKWRIGEKGDTEDLIKALTEMAAREDVGPDDEPYALKIAKRVLAGYDPGFTRELGFIAGLAPA
jgi:hypothetical protein